MANMTQLEIGQFMKLFNRGGYVLDFSTNDFDVFTMESIGVAVCSKYKMSKGKSLLAYVNEANEQDVQKLLSDLFSYYELNYESEYTKTEDSVDKYSTVYPKYDAEYSRLHKNCKKILERLGIIRTVSLAQNADALREKFSSEYLSAQIDNMLSMTSSNPTEAIGKAKELIESCCKTILDGKEILWDRNWDVGQLAGETVKTLRLMPRDIPDDAPAANEIKAILGNLRAIATNMAVVRNAYGSGHGRSASFRGLEERHAKLAVGSSITLVEFLWETYEKRNAEEI